MLLAIDVGNTNTVFAVFADDGTLKGEWRSASDTKKTADELAVWLNSLMAMKKLSHKDIDAAIIASVVPAMVFNLKKLCQVYFGCEAMVVGDEGLDLGIEVVLPNPEEVGADRLVNGLAASQKYHGPLIIIDFGTATTFDVIDGDGRYLGGAMAPGINLSIEALHMAAAKLPRVAIKKPKKAIGTSTTEAMQSGIFWGYVGLIEGMVARIMKEYGERMKVIGTGGLAPLFAEATTRIETTDADLTMQGLLAIYQRNKK